MKGRRIKIVTKEDRPHIAYDILSVLKKYDVGIIMMEVYTYVIYIKTPPISDELFSEILSDIYAIKEVDIIEEVDLIAFEERDIEIKEILDTIPQGVMILNSELNIKYANTYMAEKIIRLPVGYLGNTSLKEYVDENSLDKFLGKTIDGSVRNENLKIQNRLYTASLSSIESEDDIFLGYILSVNELKEEPVIDNFINFEDIIGESDSIVEVKKQAKEFAEQESPIFIEGEIGTGKELIARSIHDYSDRGNQPFVAVNCKSLPGKMLDLELFGIEDSEIYQNEEYRNRKSLIELADGGSLFLDEVDGLPKYLQEKLLKILNEQKIKIPNNNAYKALDLRIISSSTEDMDELIEDDLFLSELFHKLSGNIIKVPALRKRKEDIEILTKYFIDMDRNRYGGKEITIEPRALDKLYNYSWPGNIRELKTVVERAIAICEGDVIREKDILVLDENVAGMDSANISLNEVLGEIERDIIVEALGNNKSIRGTARSLDVTHTLLINRIKKYKIDESEWK